MKFNPKHTTLDFEGTPLQTYIDRDGERWWNFQQLRTLLGFCEKEALFIAQGTGEFGMEAPLDACLFPDSKEFTTSVSEAGAFRLATKATCVDFHTWLCKNPPPSELPHHSSEISKPSPVPPLIEELCKMMGTRELEYGPADLMFSEIAERWSATFKQPVTSKQVALCMIDLKLARLSRNVDHKDSLLDLIGYALCYARLKGWAD